MKESLQFILMLNLICILALSIGLRWWQRKHDKLTERKAALIITGYLSFFTVTVFSPLLKIFPRETILLDAIILLILWSVGYPWARWLYRQYKPPK